MTFKDQSASGSVADIRCLQQKAGVILAHEKSGPWSNVERLEARLSLMLIRKTSAHQRWMSVHNGEFLRPGIKQRWLAVRQLNKRNHHLL
jgi:hypothetical protein